MSDQTNRLRNTIKTLQTNIKTLQTKKDILLRQIKALKKTKTQAHFPSDETTENDLKPIIEKLKKENNDLKQSIVRLKENALKRNMYKLKKEENMEMTDMKSEILLMDKKMTEMQKEMDQIKVMPSAPPLLSATPVPPTSVQPQVLTVGGERKLTLSAAFEEIKKGMAKLRKVGKVNEDDCWSIVVVVKGATDIEVNKQIARMNNDSRVSIIVMADEPESTKIDVVASGIYFQVVVYTEETEFQALIEEINDWLILLKIGHYRQPQLNEQNIRLRL